MSSGKIAQVLAIAIGALSLAGSARALSSNAVSGEFGSAELISAVAGTGSLEQIPLGLHLTLPEGWKTYWRSPGDAGLPARIDWSASTNLAGVDIRWPIPERFSLFGLETFGYESEVVLPLVVRPTTPGAPVSLVANVDYLACKDICVPLNAELTLDLPAGPALPTEFAHLIDRFSVRVPSATTARGLIIDKAVAIGAPDSMRLVIEARSDQPVSKPDLLIEGPAGLAFGKPVQERREGGRLIRFTLPVTADEGPPLVGAPLTLTLTDGDRAVESQIGVAAGGPGDAAADGFLLVLMTALLGGLILNLMPCVLPVLSIKLLSVVGHGGGERRATRQAFLASTAGILASFAVLASAAVGLKSAGIAVGWGMQFQEPLFLVFMVVIVAFFAANLWGLFEVILPARLAGTVGDADAPGLAGHFLSGALATLLATPCSAPFLGTAIAFALSRGPIDIYAIFLALGTGMALPYLAVAAFPTLATRLPRPGAWMLTLRRVLSLALIGTALWLLWVLAAASSQSISIGVAAAILAAILSLTFLSQGRAAMVGFIALAFVVPSMLGTPTLPMKVADGTSWQPFARASIPRLVAEGKTVVVDVTAEWCLTCQVNKRLVLTDADVAARLKAPEIVTLRADWTRPDPAIAEYLASHGRYGIPFNVVYGPGRPDGLVLPELLTTTAMLDALETAKRR